MRTDPHVENCNTGVGLIAAKAMINPVNTVEAIVSDTNTDKRVIFTKRGKKQTIGDTIFDNVKPRWYVFCKKKKKKN